MSVSASASASSALTNHSTAPSLGAGTTVIKFVTTKAFWDHVCSTNQEILTFQGVSPQDFTRLNEEREHRGRSIRFRRFDAQERILIVVIPGTPHEILHLKLYREYTNQVDRMELGDDWTDTGCTTYQNRPNGNSGEGDSSGYPISQRPAADSWPTLVIEAANSSSLEDLRADMRWWFSASHHQVKIVLLTKLDRPGRRIILEKWVEIEPALSRPGPRTRSATTLTPHCNQAIIITWAPGLVNTPASHEVTRGALRLEFNLLFLRPPGPAEGDFIITAPRLQMWAFQVWRVVN